MRVALDATPLTLSSGGLRRYTEQLSTALAAEFPDDVYTLLSDQPFEPPSHLPNLRAGRLPRTRLESRWWLFGASMAVKRVHAEVFHGTNFEVPYLNLRPSTLTLHDLSPWRDPAWHGDARRVRRRAPWLLQLGIATMVVTPSEAVRREAIQAFGLAPERVVAVPLGAALLEVPNTQSAAPVIVRPFFLFGGTLEPRKNLEMLVAAWRTLRDAHDVDLVLAGRRRVDGPRFDEERGLHILGEVSDAQLAELYRTALAVVYPSHYEGFGLPVLEAMQYGAAVVISADPALQELGGDAALAARSPKEFAEVMRALLEQPALLAAHRAKSRRRAAEFSWKKTAHATRAVYGEALGPFWMSGVRGR